MKTIPPFLSSLMLLAIVSGAMILSGCKAALISPTISDYSPQKSVVFEKDFALNLYETEHSSKNEVTSMGFGDSEVLQGEVEPYLFIVKKPEWKSDIRLKSAEEEEDVLFTLRERLYRYLLRQYPHPTRVRYAHIPDDPILQKYRVIEVESQITHITKGNGVLRYVIGYGAGATTIQFEGQMFEEEQPLVEFALRQRHAAYPNGFQNPKVIKDAYTLKYGSEALVGQLTETLSLYMPPPDIPDSQFSSAR